MKLRVILFFVLFVYLSGQIVQADGNPKNIILLIGDGMGVSQITAAKTVKGKLNMDKMQVMGLVTTHSQNAYVTDSAAAGTALATGYKTNNGMLSMTPGMKPLATALETAEKQGKSTGLVVTCSITHATPAAFYAHVKHRDMHTTIAEQLMDSGLEVAFGGGRQYFLPEFDSESKRTDKKDLISLLDEKGYLVLETPKTLDTLKLQDKVVGLFASDGMERVPDRRPELKVMTEKALAVLSRNTKGFFLMVEGSQIDWAGHENNAEDVVQETMDFDEAVGVCLQYAKTNTDTLVIVTADHETGGLSLLEGSIAKKKLTKAGFGSDYHTASMVPLFAHGPGSTGFSGIQDNTDVGKRIIKLILQR
jgi:alkaline phosphatase